MSVKIHYFKCWPQPFDAVVLGLKMFEVRKDDRADRPRPGDLVLLREWVPTITVSDRGADDPALKTVGGDYTGREIFLRVTYVALPGEWGLPSGLYVMGLRDENLR